MTTPRNQGPCSHFLRFLALLPPPEWLPKQGELEDTSPITLLTTFLVALLVLVLWPLMLLPNVFSMCSKKGEPIIPWNMFYSPYVYMATHWKMYFYYLWLLGGMALSLGFLVTNTFFTFEIMSADIECADYNASMIPGLKQQECVELWMYGVDKLTAADVAAGIKMANADASRFAIQLMIVCAGIYIVIILSKLWQGYRSFAKKGELSDTSAYVIAFVSMLLACAFTWSAYGILEAERIGNTGIREFSSNQCKRNGGPECTDPQGWYMIDIIAGFSTFLTYRYLIIWLTEQKTPVVTWLRSQHTTEFGSKSEVVPIMGGGLKMNRFALQQQALGEVA